MGTRLSGVVFPFNGDIEKAKIIVEGWLHQLPSLIEPNTPVYLSQLQNNCILVQHWNLFNSAYNEPELWENILYDFKDCLIFFECIDSCDSTGYILYHGRTEVRRLLQEENKAGEIELKYYGTPLSLEEKWLNSPTFYVKEYYENNDWYEERIDDPNFCLSSTEVEEGDTYYKYHYLDNIEHSILDKHLARLFYPIY